jgi:hypothetical protein
VAGTLVCVIVAAALLRTSAALAFMITMQGPDDARIETASGLYATVPDGRLKKIIDTGAQVAGGGVIADFGNPAIASDGSLFFPALLQFGKKFEWRILRAYLMEGSRARTEELFDTRTLVGGCRPNISSDPRIAIGGDGSIVFIAGDQHGRSTLFRFAKGQLACEVQAGESTAQGHVITNMGFGSAQVGDDGSVALLATLSMTSGGTQPSDSRKAILLASTDGGVRELAREGDSAPGGRRYGPEFSAPAIANGGTNLLVAFTNHSEVGNALYVGRPGLFTQALVTGTDTTSGPITYLSNARPSLAVDGSVAVEAASRERAMILDVRAGELFRIAREGDRIGNSRIITGLASPVLLSDGRVYIEVADQMEGDAVYSFAPTGPNAGTASSARLSSAGILVFPSSFVLNGKGAYAFLSRSSEHEKSKSARPVGKEDQTSL